MEAATRNVELTLDEASKVHAVIKASLERLALVGVINVDMQEQAALLTRSVGQEVSAMINHQAVLGQRFEALIAQQHHLRQDGLKTKQSEVKAEMKIVAEQLRGSIESLSEKLRDNPNVAENMLKVSNERQLLQTLLHSALDELVTERQLKGILNMVHADSSRHKEMQDVVDWEKAAARAVVTLRTELLDEQAEHDKVMQHHKKRIAALKAGIRARTRECHISQCHTLRELESANDCAAARQDQHLVDLSGELGRLRKMLLLEENAQAAATAHLEKEQTDLQAEAVQWHERMVQDVQAQVAALENLRNRHRALLKEFKELEPRYNQEHAANEQRVAAKQAQLQAESDSRAALAAKSKAAARIQAQWRGLKVRQEGGRAKGKKGKKKR